MKYSTEHLPPTNKAEDCICGAMASKDGLRYAVLCPACDGECIEVPNMVEVAKK